MAVSLAFIMERALATLAAQAALGAQWQWVEWTMNDWDIQIGVFKAQLEIVADSRAQWNSAVADFDVTLDELHEDTVTCLSLLKVLHRRASAISNFLRPLSARGDSRNSIFEEAAELAAAWNSINPAWEPLPGKSLATFMALIKHCKALNETRAEKDAAWRGDSSELIEFAAALNRNCVAWYEVATVIFSDKTPAGRMVRGTVPTTYKASLRVMQPEFS